MEAMTLVWCSRPSFMRSIFICWRRSPTNKQRACKRRSATLDYHDLWLNPVIEEEISCKQEIGNAHDAHAVAVHNIIDEDIKTVERIPRKISAPDMRGLIFIRRGTVYCQRESPMLLRFAKS